MARGREIKARSFVRFRDNPDVVIPMEEVNANPELRKKFDERLKAVLEEGIPRCETYMQALMNEQAAKAQ